jgi:predicted nucleic acid-binding protein
MTLWIVDTSPLIFLAKLNRLDLLKRGADQIVAPPAVFREIGEVVLDDLDARRFAHRIGLVPVGTLGLLLAAKLRGEIKSLREEIDRLIGAGFRVSPPLVQAFLREAGERSFPA